VIKQYTTRRTNVCTLYKTSLYIYTIFIHNTTRNNDTNRVTPTNVVAHSIYYKYNILRINLRIELNTNIDIEQIIYIVKCI